MAAKMVSSIEIILSCPLVMPERHVIHQNSDFGGCSIEIFRFESCLIVIFRVIGYVMLVLYI